MTKKRWTLGLAAVAGVVSTFVVVVAQVTSGGTNVGSSVPPLDVPQTASAKDQGISISAVSAAFSATGTFIAVRVDTSEYEAQTGKKVARITAPSEGMSESTVLSLAVDAQSLPVGREAVIRLSPIVGGGAQQLVIKALDVSDDAGDTIRVNGRWVLPLALPARVSDALRTEVLRSLAPAADDRGIVFRGVSAVRSTTETLLTVELDSPTPLSPFAEPWFFSPGLERMFCRLVETKEDGKLFIYTCPSTPFGSNVSILFLTLIDDRKVEGTYSTKLDLAAMMQHQGVTGAAGESLVVTPSDAVTDDPGGSPVLSMTFGTVTRDGGSMRAIKFTLRGNFDDPDTISLVSATGRILLKNFVDSGYRKDQAGAISEGTTEVGFRYNDPAEIAGTVQLTYGAPTLLVHGNWELQFEPVP